MITLTGTFLYEDSTPIDGRIRLSLIRSDGQYITVGTAQELGTQIPVPHWYDITLTGGSIDGVVGHDPVFTSADAIHGTNDIAPPDTLYRCRVYDAIDREILPPVDVQITSSPFDLSTAQPVTVPTLKATSSLLVSKPPSGSRVVKNLYVNPSGMIVVEYDTSPV